MALTRALTTQYSQRSPASLFSSTDGPRHARRGVLTARPRQSPKCVASANSATSIGTDAATYLKEVASVAPPPTLPILLSVLQAQGFSPSDPSQRRGVVPLLVPLVEETQKGRRLALLRWPTPPEGLELPLVSIESDNTIRLQARSGLEYINRALAEEDSLGSSECSVKEAVEEASRKLGGDESACAWLYKEGEFAASGLPRIDAFLLRKVGPFPDVFERLTDNHLKNGDEVSALVTGEFYASKKHFPGFGRPFMFNAELLARVGRPSEARDAARIALRSPWWTLGVPYQEAADLAGYGTTLLEYAQERVSEEGRLADIQKGKSPGQVSLDQAAFLMDVATVDNSWDAIRDRLASLYDESGLPEVARFVRAV